MISMLKLMTKFGLSLLAMTVACTILWEWFVNDRLYNCTDAIGLDYLHPGDWTHHPVAVQHVIGRRPMSEPDTIKAGWTITGLWGLWGAFLFVSVTVSACCAMVPWLPKSHNDAEE
jgi:hypothetical protein